MNTIKLIRHNRGLVAMGTREQMYSFVKHHVKDGQFYIDDGTTTLVVLREDGVVHPLTSIPSTALGAMNWQTKDAAGAG